MMKFQDIASGTTMFFDALHIAGVVPAFAPPPRGIEPDKWIPRAIGSQLIIAGCAPVAVRGLCQDIADNVIAAKAAASRAAITIA